MRALIVLSIVAAIIGCSSEPVLKKYLGTNYEMYNDSTIVIINRYDSDTSLTAIICKPDQIDELFYAFSSLEGYNFMNAEVRHSIDVIFDTVQYTKYTFNDMVGIR
jgi:hypothetical protein